MKEPEYLEPVGQLIVQDEGKTGFYWDVLHLWSDGLRWDGEEVDTPALEEYPNDKEAREKYIKEVSITGNDYLNLFMVKQTEPQKWQVYISQWIGQSQYGLRVIKGRKGTRHLDYPANNLPEEVIEFICAENHGGSVTMPDFKSFSDIEKQHDNADFKVLRGGICARLTFVVDGKRNPKKIAAETKRKAKRALMF